jgi:putative hydrolase of the HAD superfamily
LIKAILTDLGGVLLTNGWDYSQRKGAAEHFGLDFLDIEKRHSLVVGVYEEGRMKLDAYLGFVIFNKERPFTPDDFFAYMKEQSQPYDDVIDLYKQVKRDNPIQIVAVSNEGRDLAEHRARVCGLKSFIDAFIVSAFVGARKPDPSIFNIALDVAQVSRDEVLFVDDREMLVEAAGKIGIPSYWHRSAKETAEELKRQGLRVAAG